MKNISLKLLNKFMLADLMCRFPQTRVDLLRCKQTHTASQKLIIIQANTDFRYLEKINQNYQLILWSTNTNAVNVNRKYQDTSIHVSTHKGPSQLRSPILGSKTL